MVDRVLARGVRYGLVVAGMSLGLAACGSTSASPHSASAIDFGGESSCSKVPASKAVKVVVEPSSHKVISGCTAIGTSSIPALTLLSKAHIELGTQKYSFGLALCQVDHVPAHYVECLPAKANYWGVYVAKARGKWISSSLGISDIRLTRGESLGLRYVPPVNNPPMPAGPGRL
ncbi:hypothetical protein [Ferrimicrobium sp.]|uniref:hypothetical protein n=1 Tax=Ferrimicrobium sp. TaxID=2926050 RepID=UPI00262022FD|nr:hypothetical protein [Ferrimicrobium sp.]